MNLICNFKSNYSALTYTKTNAHLQEKVKKQADSIACLTNVGTEVHIQTSLKHGYVSSSSDPTSVLLCLKICSSSDTRTLLNIPHTHRFACFEGLSFCIYILYTLYTIQCFSQIKKWSSMWLSLNSVEFNPCWCNPTLIYFLELN